jgi:hypothetical protein
VRLTCSVLSGGTLQDSRADSSAASRRRAVGGTTSATLSLDLDGLGVSDFLFDLVGDSSLGAGIDHTLDGLVFGDFFGGVSLVLAAGAVDAAKLFAASEAAARWEKRGYEAEEEKWDQFFHECLR